MRLLLRMILACLPLTPCLAHAVPRFEIDCTHVANPMERGICQNPTLLAAARDVAVAYKPVLDLAGKHAEQIGILHRAWLHRTGIICGLPEKEPTGDTEGKSGCVLAQINERSKALQSLRDAAGFTTWVTHDATMAIPYTPASAIGVLRIINDGGWGKEGATRSSDSSRWGEILAIYYYTKPGGRALARVRMLQKHLSPMDEIEKLRCDPAGCPKATFANDDWIVAGLQGSQFELVLPCRMFAEHEELIQITQAYWGSNRDNFIPGAQCIDREYPLPSSITALEKAVHPYDGGVFGPDAGSIRFGLFATLRMYALTARVAPKLLLKASKRLDGINFPAEVKDEDGEPETFPLETWSYDSVFNRRVFLRIRPLFTKAVDELAAIYRERMKLSSREAHRAAYMGVRQQIYWTFMSPPPNAVALAIMRTDVTPDLAAVLAAPGPLPSFAEPLMSMAVDRPDAIRALLSAHVPVNVGNAFGKTPLMTAAQFDDLDALDMILLAGADVNRQSMAPADIPHNDPPFCGSICIKHGQRTALMYAAANASLPVIERLITAGADRTLKDSTGLTAFDYLQGHGQLPPNPILNEAERKLAEALLRTE